MAFNILVGEKNPSDDFTVTDLVLHHTECGGGPISSHIEGGYLNLNCKRCRMTADVQVSEDGTAALVLTAIDGRPRNLLSVGGHFRGVIASRRRPANS